MLLDVVGQGPVLGAQVPHDLRRTAEALPIVVPRNVLHAGPGQVLHDALLAEHVRTLGAAVHFAALSAPPAVQLAAVLALVKLAAVVKRVAVPAVRYPQHRVHPDYGLRDGGRSDVHVARGAVHLAFRDLVHVGKGPHEELLLLVGRFVLEREPEPWNREMQQMCCVKF